MRTYGNDLAFPATAETASTGLTKREYFASAALQGILAGALASGPDNKVVDLFLVSKNAIAAADRLIEALNKEE